MSFEVGANPAVGPATMEELYQREWAGLARVALLLTGSRAVAEELAQDAFLKLMVAGDRVANPAGYLRTIVVNACRSHHRHQSVVARAALRPAEPALAQPDELGDAVARLPWRQQAALVLRFHLDLPEEEIAAILGCRPATVRSIHRRALATLRKELSA